MDNRVKFYCWLIALLEQKHLTFREIADEWEDASCNPFHEELTLRTFHRHREAIASQFGITVECDKADGYRYYVTRDKVECDETTEWMLSSMRLASLGEQLKYHNKVMLDTPPYHSAYLDDILGAIDKHYLLKFKYVSAFGAESDMLLQPAFVRYFKQRWYVIGVKASPEKVDEKTLVRCLPFDRINSLDIICEKHPLSAKMKKFLTPEIYYDSCFGIMRVDDEPVEHVRIRAFYPEYNLIEEVPLHASQRRLVESEDSLYRDYELTIRPSRDFLQELLWHGRNIMVLQPESLRQKMIGILKDMTRSYETGECTNGEEE